MSPKPYCDEHCRTDGFNLVLEECPDHGGLFLRVYRHVRAVDVGELPLIISGEFGTVEGEHAFYDSAVRALTACLIEMIRTD